MTGPAAARRARRGVVAQPHARGASRGPRSARIAQRRITDAATKTDPSGLGRRARRRATRRATPSSPGRGSTRWREQLAAILDQPPYEPVAGRARARGASGSPSTALLAAWLRLTLDVPVDWAYLDSGRSGRTASSRSRWCARAARCCWSAHSRAWRSSPSPGSRCTTWPSRAGPARMPRREAPSPRPGRPVWSSHHRGLAAAGPSGDEGDAAERMSRYGRGE